MCEASVVGASVAFIGGAVKGAAAQDASRKQANILDRNAAIADRSSVDAIDRGDVAATKIDLQASQTEAHQEAQYAASGVDVHSGSAVDVISGTAAMSALEAAITKSNAQREAWGFRTQAKNFRSQAQITRDAGDTDAINSILGGVAGAASAGSGGMKVG